MANEATVSNLSDQRVAAILAARYGLLLADREGGALAHPVIAANYAGYGGAGSLVLQVPRIGLFGYDLAVSGAENTDPDNTALSDGSSNITLAAFEKSYGASDLARMTDLYGVFDAEIMAGDMAVTVVQTMINSLAALATGFSTNVVGASGVKLTVQDFTDGITLLEVAKVSGLLMALLHPQQWGNMRTDGLSLGGAAQHRPDAQGLLGYAGGLYKGEFFGVDTFTSSQCDSSDAGANVNGMIAGAGAFHWGLGQLVPEPMDSNIIDMGIPGTPVLGRLERIRSGGAGTTRWMQRFVFGCIEGLDAAAVRVRSDAP